MNFIEEKRINILIEMKFKDIYSNRLRKKVYILNKWLDKDVFLRHKELFIYTDIGWSVKFPKQLARKLVIEGVW